MKLTPDEALRIRVGEEARARAMAVVDQGGQLVIAAMHFREAAEAYRLASEALHQRALDESRRGA